MKKYLISGFNTVQDVKLEVGTYTLVAYVKSMHGDVYTFALGDGTDWEEFSIDVIQGQLCKVWLTFTIDKKATKFKPIANNFTEELPVYVADLQLTRGNIPVESGASPFDIDQILNDLHDEIDAIEDFTEGAFLDGLLSREEKTQLRASLDSIGAIVKSVEGSYDKLLDNPFIHENTMTSITARYYAFIASWISDGDPRGLKPVILWIVNGDNIISQNERDEKDRALNAFNDALYAYNQAEKEVYNDVGAEIDAAKKAGADASAEVVNMGESLTEMVAIVTGALEDKVIDEAERKTLIAEQKTLDTEQERLLALINSLLGSAYLVGDANTALSDASNATLKASTGTLDVYQMTIDVMINADVITEAMISAYEGAYDNHKSGLSSLNVAIENARKAIDIEVKRLSDEKVDDIEIGGTNLLSGLNREYYLNNTETSDTNIIAKAFNFKRNSEYVISYDVKGTGETYFVVGGYPFPISTTSSDGQTGADAGGHIAFPLINEWKRVWIKIKTANWSDEEQSKTIYLSARANSEVSIRGIMFVSGNKAFDWSPAPEDVQAEIDDVNTGLTDLGTEIDTAFSNLSITNIEANNLDLLRKSLAKEVADVRAIAVSMGVSVVDLDSKMSALNTEVNKYAGKVDSVYPITVTEANRTAIDTAFSNLESSIVALYEAIDNKRVDAAVIKATYWSIKASTPVIYKDANSATASGVHTPVTVTGELRSGTTTTQGGFISIQPNGGAESAAIASPRTIAPTNAEGKTSYTVRLYEKADKVTLLDTMTIPVVFKGASGVNAINAILSNEADVLPASPEGVVSDYTGSGTIIRVFEGATELTYGTGNGQYQVSASGSGINVGTSSTVGNTRVYGVASSMTSDNATITFTISGKTSSGASFSLTKVQTFAKSRVGQKGKDAVAPIIIDGFWAFWNKETETFIPSEFSAIGDDGHAPIIRDGYWYEWNPDSTEEDKYEPTGVRAEGVKGDGAIEKFKSSATQPSTPTGEAEDWDDEPTASQYATLEPVGNNLYDRDYLIQMGWTNYSGYVSKDLTSAGENLINPSLLKPNKQYILKGRIDGDSAGSFLDINYTTGSKKTIYVFPGTVINETTDKDRSVASIVVRQFFVIVFDGVTLFELDMGEVKNLPIWATRKTIINGVESAWSTPVKWSGEDGEKGKDGTGINVVGSADTWNSLPTSGNNLNDARIVQDTGVLAVWDGTKWVEAGEIKGPAGDTPYIGGNGNWWIGGTDTGIKAKGEKGDPGDKGDPGTSVRILGSKTSPSLLPSSGNLQGDGYLIDGDLWVYDGTSSTPPAPFGWANVGRIKGEKGKDGSSYLVMGYWNANYEYQLSDAGIPVVKQPGSATFLAYKLIVPKSTVGQFINTGTNKEWELVDSSEFTYMLEAYIEVLQAELITAEKIEALNIRTSRLEVTDGAKIGGMEISGDMLVSQNGRVVVDGVNNAIYLLDENGSIKTALRPDDLPALSSYFSSAVSREIDVTPIVGSYIESSPTQNSTSVTLPNGYYEAIIPAMTLKAFATSTSSLGGGVSMRVELVGGDGVFTIGTVSAWASSANSDSQSRLIPKKTIALNKGGSYYLKATLTNDSIGGSYASGSGEVIASSNLVINQVVNRSEIGNNGMMIATSKTRYDYMVGGVSEVRRGDYILKVTEDGIQKSSNGGSNWDDI